MAKPDDGTAAPNKDYTGQGTGPEEIGVIETEEQLAAYLKDGGAAAQAGKNGTPGTPAAGAKPAAPAPPTKVITDPNAPGYKIPEKLGEEDEESEEEEEFTNVVDYLNKEFDLGLAIENLPADMTRQQEAEAIGGIFRKINDGMRARLGEYSAIDNLLKDKEVALFLQAKKEGKSLKDIAAQYNTAPASAPDDVVVSRHIKAMYPTMTDAEIAEEVAELRTKNKLDKRATAARDFFKAEDARAATAKQAEEEQLLQQQEQEYAQSVDGFARFLHTTNAVYGIQVTPDMKKKVFDFVTRRDNEGITEHDRFLQSEAGTFLSALSHLYLKDLLRTKGSVKANKGKQEFVEKLFETPEKLQSGSEAQIEPGELNPALMNQF